MSFDVRHTSVREVPVLQVTGELDVLTAPRLADEVERALAERPALLALDLTATTFIDSSGARQIARAARAAGRSGAALQVVCPPTNRPVRLVFDLLSIDSVVPVLPSTDLVGRDSRP
ncbi:STAS domain-containing protein [Geodermatophilus sp. SYSU D00815]